MKDSVTSKYLINVLPEILGEFSDLTDKDKSNLKELATKTINSKSEWSKKLFLYEMLEILQKVNVYNANRVIHLIDSIFKRGEHETMNEKATKLFYGTLTKSREKLEKLAYILYISCPEFSVSNLRKFTERIECELAKNDEYEECDFIKVVKRAYASIEGHLDDDSHIIFSAKEVYRNA